MEFHYQQGFGAVHMRKAIRPAIATLTVGLAVTVKAGPSGLVSIPIADILRHRELLAGYGASATEQNVSKLIGHTAGVEIGLFDRFELGYDTDFLGGNVFNAKALLLEDKDSGYAFSAGFQNYMPKTRYIEPFAVGRYNFKDFRLHAGWLKTDTSRLICGVDFPIGNATGMIEHTGGPGSVTQFGVSFPVPQLQGLSVLMSVGLPSRRSDGISGGILINYGVRL